MNSDCRDFSCLSTAVIILWLVNLRIFCDIAEIFCDWALQVYLGWPQQQTYSVIRYCRHILRLAIIGIIVETPYEWVLQAYSANRYCRDS